MTKEKFVKIIDEMYKKNNERISKCIDLPSLFFIYISSNIFRTMQKNIRYKIWWWIVQNH